MRPTGPFKGSSQTEVQARVPGDSPESDEGHWTQDKPGEDVLQKYGGAHLQRMLAGVGREIYKACWENVGNTSAESTGGQRSGRLWRVLRGRGAHRLESTGSTGAQTQRGGECTYVSHLPPLKL